MPNLEVWAPRVLSLLRIMAALLFMQHGLMKLFGFPGPQEGAPDPLPPLLIALRDSLGSSPVVLPPPWIGHRLLTAFLVGFSLAQSLRLRATSSGRALLFGPRFGP